MRESVTRKSLHNAVDDQEWFVQEYGCQSMGVMYSQLLDFLDRASPAFEPFDKVQEDMTICSQHPS